MNCTLDAQEERYFIKKVNSTYMCTSITIIVSSARKLNYC